MEKFSTKTVEFYITNVCNLDCPECNRFNNYKFKGHYRFNSEQYKKWPDLIDPERINILGGEPTFNPHLEEFVEGVGQLWPTTNKFIVTNGTNLAMHKRLHELCAKYNWVVEISIHSPHLKQLIGEQIQKSFGNCKVIKFNNSNPTDGVFMVVESVLGVKIVICHGTSFHKNSIKNKQTLETYKSDPIKSHNLCTMKSCHEFIDGKLYKCGVVKLLPDLYKQYGIALDPLMLEYKPFDSNSTVAELSAINEHIPQCTFCSDNPEDWSIVLKNNSRLKKKIIPIELQN